MRNWLKLPSSNIVALSLLLARILCLTQSCFSQVSMALEDSGSLNFNLQCSIYHPQVTNQSEDLTGKAEAWLADNLN